MLRKTLLLLLGYYQFMIIFKSFFLDDELIGFHLPRRDTAYAVLCVWSGDF